MNERREFVVKCLLHGCKGLVRFPSMPLERQRDWNSLSKGGLLCVDNQALWCPLCPQGKVPVRLIGAFLKEAKT